MSDDLISNFIQLSSAVESKKPAGVSQDPIPQGADFNRVISQEKKKLFAAQGALRDSKPESLDVQAQPDSTLGNYAEAMAGQNLATHPSPNGKVLPSLSLHNGALAVGRVIYTAETGAVTSESMSKFMARQGLVSERLQPKNDFLSDEPSRDKETLIANLMNQREDGEFAAEKVLMKNFNQEAIPSPRNQGGRLIDSAEIPKVVPPAVNLINNPEGAVSSIVVPSIEEALTKSSPQGQTLPPGYQADKLTVGERILKTIGSDPSAIDKAMTAAGGNVASQLTIKQMLNGRGVITVDRPVNPADNDATGKMTLMDQIPGLETRPHAGRNDYYAVGSNTDTGGEKNQSRENINPLSIVTKKEILFTDRQALGEADLQPPVTGSNGEFKRGFRTENEGMISSKAKNEMDTQTNSTKLEANRELELPRLHAVSEEAEKRGVDKAQSILTSHVDNTENSLKTYREVGQSTSQEGFNADSGQNRVEFKGALRDAQRMLASNTYNNLTDSYENWNAKFGEVLAQRIAGFVNKENWNIQLRLNPASLGEISLELELSEKGLEGRFGSNEESTRQLLQDTLPKLRLALRDLLDESQGLSFDVSDFGNSNSNDDAQSEKSASPDLIEEINFETEVLLGRTLDSRLSSVVGLDILV
jgi:flagellar hook-length control protein FliK